MAESEDESKSFLVRVKEESEKAGLKLNVQKTKIMASSSITSRQTEGKKMEAVIDFIFLGSKITAVVTPAMNLKDTCSLKAMTNLHSILKNINITLLTKVHIVKVMIFPVVVYGCESRTIKKAECKRTDTFKRWCWRRLLSPLDCKEIQPVNPKGNQP